MIDKIDPITEEPRVEVRANPNGDCLDFWMFEKRIYSISYNKLALTILDGVRKIESGKVIQTINLADVHKSFSFFGESGDKLKTKVDKALEKINS